MKKHLSKIFIPQDKLIVDDIVDVQTLHLFRVKLLASILLTASVVGLGTGMLEYFNLLPQDTLYTPLVISYSFVNFIAYLLLKQNQNERYIFAMHLCISSALATFSVMSISLLYDEFRFIWFFLLSFASFMLGGKWYGLSVSAIILTIIYTQFFMTDLHFSAYALFTFTAGLLTFNVFSIIFLDKIEQDSMTMQRHISKEVEKRIVQEYIVEKMHQQETINLKNGYLWDRQQKILTQGNQHVVLTQKEQQLLALLLENNNQCVTFEEIQARLWEEKYDEEISIASVKVQVTKLRKKLPQGSIKNVYGCGYIFHS